MKNYLDSRTPAERKNDGKIKSITTSTPPQSDWEKEFDEKFATEIHTVVIIQLKQFIGKLCVEKVGQGFQEGYKEGKQEALAEKIKEIEEYKKNAEKKGYSGRIIASEEILLILTKGRENYKQQPNPEKNKGEGKKDV